MVKCSKCGVEFNPFLVEGADYTKYVFCEQCIQESTKQEKRNSQIRKKQFDVFLGNEKRAKLLKESNLPTEFITYNIKLGNPQLLKFVAQNIQKSIFLFSRQSGITKTRTLIHVSAKMIREHFLTVRFFKTTTLARLLAMSYDKGGPDRIINELSNVKLLILDDLGKEKLTDRSCELLYDIIDNRYMSNRQIWITSNYSCAELEERIGGRGRYLMRRIKDMCIIWVHQQSKHQKII